MNCPYCSKELIFYASIECESEDRVVSYFHQWWKCRRCREYFYAMLVEYVFDESLTHYGYRAEKDVWKSDLKLIKRCRDRRNPQCKCEIHKMINEISGHYQVVAWHSYSK
jgi:hypothetical protein